MRVFVIAAVTFAAIIGTSKVIHLTVAEIVAAWLAWAVLVAVLYGRKLLADDDDYEPEPHERAILYGADLADSFGMPREKFWESGYPDEREPGRHRGRRRLLPHLSPALAAVWHAPQSAIIGTVWLSRCVRDLLGPAYPGVPQSNFKNVPRAETAHAVPRPGYPDVPVPVTRPRSGTGTEGWEGILTRPQDAEWPPGQQGRSDGQGPRLASAAPLPVAHYRPSLATYAGLAELAAEPVPLPRFTPADEYKTGKVVGADTWAEAAPQNGPRASWLDALLLLEFSAHVRVSEDGTLVGAPLERARELVEAGLPAAGPLAITAGTGAT